MKNTTNININLNELYETINNALQLCPNSTIERPADMRWFVNLDWTTDRVKKISAELSIGQLDKHQAKVFGKKFHADQPVIWVNTYVTDEDGCFGIYNPQIMTTKRTYKNKVRFETTINFDWLLDATAENAFKLLDEVKSMAMSGISMIQGEDEYIDEII